MFSLLFAHVDADLILNIHILRTRVTFSSLWRSYHNLRFRQGEAADSRESDKQLLLGLNHDGTLLLYDQVWSF
jgi:hypothetical protein